MSRYEENLALLGRRSPVVATLLGCEGEAAQAAPDSLDTARKWFSQLKLDTVWVLYVFGVGQGFIYQVAKEWLGQVRGRHLVFLEDQVSALKGFLECEGAEAVLKDKRVRIEMSGGLLATSRYFAPLPYHIGVLPAYEARPEWKSLLLELGAVADATQAVAYQALHQNTTTYRLLYPAVAAMAGNLDGAGLFGKFEGVPAIICGAGPSLDKQLPLLKELRDRALIFGGGSALTALSRGGVRPHFGAGVSPHPDEFDRFWRSNGFEIPFFWKTRVNPEALEVIQGPRLYNRSGQPVMRYLEEEMGIPQAEPIREGPTVTYYLTDLVAKLGCNPILYVGVDLALTGGKSYAAGVGEADEAEIEVEGVPTLFKWIWESKSLGELAKMHSDTQYFNCTEGGLGIEGVEARPLAEMNLPPGRDLEGRVRAELTRCDLGLTRDKVVGTLQSLKESVERCLDLFGQMSAALGEIEERLKEMAAAIVEAMRGSFTAAGQLDREAGQTPPWIKSGKMALLQMELDEEPAFAAIFQSMVEARATYHKRIHDDFVASIGTDYQVFQWQRELTIKQELFRFLQQAAEDNLMLLGGDCLGPLGPACSRGHAP